MTKMTDRSSRAARAAARVSPLLAALAALAAAPSAVHAQKIVANSDDWTLHNNGFSQDGSTVTFVKNVTTFFGGKSGSKFLAYSNNSFIYGSTLRGTMSGLGYNYSAGTAASFTLANLQQYQGVFVGGAALSDPQLTALKLYVQGGGNVYVYGGSGGVNGTAAGEAAQWNKFLNPFGLNMASSFNGYQAWVPTVGSTSPLLSGVNSLFTAGGQNLSLLGESDASIFLTGGGNNLMAVYDGSVAPVPEPGVLVSGASMAGMVGLGLVRGRRRQRRADSASAA